MSIKPPQPRFSALDSIIPLCVVLRQDRRQTEDHVREIAVRDTQEVATPAPSLIALPSFARHIATHGFPGRNDAGHRLELEIVEVDSESLIGSVTLMLQPEGAPSPCI